MNLKVIFAAAQAGAKISEKWIIKNLPTILTTIGTGGVIAGTVMAAKKAPEAKEELDEIREEWDSLEDQEKRNKADYVFKLVRVGTRYYWTVAVVVGGSIACFWVANHLNLKRLSAALIAAKASAESLKELEDKIKETDGEKKLTKLKDEIAADRIEKVPIDFDGMYGSGEHLVYDSLGRHFFMSDIERVREAVRNAKDDLIDQLTSGDDYAFYSFNDFISDCGGEVCDFGELLGFQAHVDKYCASPATIRDAVNEAVDISFSSVLKNGVPALAINYDSVPKYRDLYE